MRYVEASGACSGHSPRGCGRRLAPAEPWAPGKSGSPNARHGSGSTATGGVASVVGANVDSGGAGGAKTRWGGGCDDGRAGRGVGGADEVEGHLTMTHSPCLVEGPEPPCCENCGAVDEPLSEAGFCQGCTCLNCGCGGTMSAVGSLRGASEGAHTPSSRGLGWLRWWENGQ
jgi:hypothetical protein